MFCRNAPDKHKLRAIDKDHKNKLVKKLLAQGNTGSGLNPLVVCNSGHTLQEIKELLESSLNMTDDEILKLAKVIMFWANGGNHYIAAMKEARLSNPKMFRFINAVVTMKIKDFILLSKVKSFLAFTSFLHDVWFTFLIVFRSLASGTTP